MASDRAKIAKDQGNAAFKLGDYPAAIGHYTSAIIANADDSTFPLNRAAAYLKLGKNEDAERDCTTVLKLSPNNVKALFRRGQARMGLGCLDEACAGEYNIFHAEIMKNLNIHLIDFVRASELEPSNQSVKQELLEVDKLIRQRKQKHDSAMTSRPIATPSGLASAIKRRRVPIKIVEDVSRVLHHRGTELVAEDTEKQPKGLEDNGLLQPISSRVLPRSNEPSSTSVKPNQSTTPPLSRQTTSARTESYKDAKQLRDIAKPSCVGGGIFQPSGNHTLFARNVGISSAASVTNSRSVMIDRTIPQAPMTLFNFTKMWESHMEDEDRWNILSGIPPSSLPNMFQASLEPVLLSSILQHFERFIDLHIAAPHDVRKYLVSLSRVQRFGTIMLFMNKDEKILLQGLWERCGISGKLDNLIVA
ncbi:TPR-like protein [Suillus decipiens]|nr:TPR-like protein [Suillus decipiens]